jgi:hypothetical protein
MIMDKLVLLHNINRGDKIMTKDKVVLTVKEVQIDVEPERSLVYVMEGKGAVVITDIVKVGE